MFNKRKLHRIHEGIAAFTRGFTNQTPGGLLFSRLFSCSVLFLDDLFVLPQSVLPREIKERGTILKMYAREIEDRGSILRGEIPIP
jgi:DNA replication protein DnaC